MPCQVCGQSDHAARVPGRHRLLDCPLYAAVPLPLKNIIRLLWERNPQTTPAKDLPEWIYETLYAPGAAQQQALGWTSWLSPFYTGATVHLIEERIYVAVRSERLGAVWVEFVTLFQRHDMDIVQAKHCDANVADTRPDAVVIYCRNRAGTWRFLDDVRELIAQERLSRDDFRDDAPPVTGRIADLRGFATALQPASGSSFGEELCHHLATAFTRFNKPMRVPVMLDFMERTLGLMRQAGVNLGRPWQRPPQVI